MKSNDPLNQLLRQALHEQKSRVTVTLLGTNSQISGPSRQCDRPQWTTTRLVSLVHRSAQGRETFLGVYTEMKNDLLKARRLVPSDKTAHGSLAKEVVTGDWWLHPQVYQPLPETAREVREIEARFKELMEQYKNV